MKKIILILLFCASQTICLAQNYISTFGNRTICGFTEDNVIYSSTDGGASWHEVNFNKKYKRFYPSMTFISTAAGANSIAIVGTDNNGQAHCFISSEGKEWSERELSWLENGSPVFLSTRPIDIIYDEPRDQYHLNCSDGNTLLLPPCSHCNQLIPTSTAELLLKH